MKHKEQMTREELAYRLRDIFEQGNDSETDHKRADELLLRFIDDAEVTQLFHMINKVY